MRNSDNTPCKIQQICASESMWPYAMTTASHTGVVGMMVPLMVLVAAGSTRGGAMMMLLGIQH
jgi:hypothetical protein